MIAKARSEMVKRAAVARFLEKDMEEIDRLMEEDGLPHQRLPGANKPSIRIFLPDFHTWMLRHTRGEVLEITDYTKFKAAFLAAQPAVKPRQRRKKTNLPTPENTHA